MLNLNNADKQVELSEEEHHKIEMELLIESAIHLIDAKIPTDREDLRRVALMAEKAGVEIPRIVTSRIDGGKPAKRGRVVKVSESDNEYIKKRYEADVFCHKYHGHRSWNIKPAHIDIRDRKKRLNAIAKDLNMPIQGIKSWEKFLTRWHKENPDYKEQAFI
jgi:hypothetical protein